MEDTPSDNKPLGTGQRQHSDASWETKQARFYSSSELKVKLNSLTVQHLDNRRHHFFILTACLLCWIKWQITVLILMDTQD